MNVMVVRRNIANYISGQGQALIIVGFQNNKDDPSVPGQRKV